MTNFGIQLVGTANVSQQVAALKALQLETDKLNASLMATGHSAAGINPAGFQKMQKMAAQNSNFMRAAANSTGMWHSEQLKLTSATETYTKSLQKQRLTWKEFIRDGGLMRGTAKAAFREQLQLQNALVQKQPMGRGGKGVYDLHVPTEVTKDMGRFSQRVGFMREQLRALSTTTINWGKNTQWAGRQMMVGLSMPIAAFGAASAVMTYQIDKQLTRIAKVYDTTANQASSSAAEQKRAEQELIDLRESSMKTATNAAKQYGAAGTDTLSVQAELAATGKRGAELQRATSEVMRASMLGEMDYNDTLQATISLQSVFGMKSKELADTFNYMNSVENATSLQMKDFATAIPIAAAPIKSMGGDIKTLGTLMTAMRSRGIKAAEGANAVKAAAQRLYRPSKQIREEFAALTGGDIVNIRDRNKGDLVGMLTDIYNLTKDLSLVKQNQVFSGLFGTYQRTRMQAMINGVGDLSKGIGQTSVAAKIAQQSTEQWASVADREAKRAADSISGKFKRALETVKMEMVEFGKPFLSAAAAILKAIGWMLDKFNSLPGVVKFFAKIGIAAVALIPVLIMLVGLGANLFGNLMKMGVAVMGLAGRMNLLTKETRAAQLAEEMAAKGYVSQRKEAEMLRASLERLTLAQIESNRAMGLRMPLLNSAGRPVGGGGGSFTTSGSGLLIPMGAAGTLGGPAPTPEQTQKTGRFTQIMATGMQKYASNALIGASALAMMASSSNDVADGISKWLFMGALFGPMLTEAVLSMRKIKAAAIGTAIANQFSRIGGAWKTAREGAKATAASATAGRVAMAGWRGGVMAVGRGFLGLLGPVGWTIAALGTGIFLFKKWRDHIAAVNAEQRKQTKEINNSATAYSNLLNIKERARKDISVPIAGDIGGSTELERVTRGLKESDRGKTLINAYQENNAAMRNAIATRQYVDVLNMVGGNARKARISIEALFLAAGEGAFEADEHARSLAQTLNSMPKPDAARWADKTMIIGASDDPDKAEVQGKELGKRMSNAIASAKADKKFAVFQQMKGAYLDAWRQIFNDLDDMQKKRLRDIGIRNAKQLMEAMSDYHPSSATDEKYSTTVPNMQNQNRQLVLDSIKQGSGIIASEKEQVKYMVEKLHLSKDINTFKELEATWEFQLATMGKKNANQVLRNKLNTISGGRGIVGTIDKQIAGYKGINSNLELQAIRQWRLARGWKDITSIVEGYTGVVEMATAAAAAGSGAVAFKPRMGRVERTFNKNAGTLLHDAVAQWQQDLADATSERFDNSMNRALEATQKMGQRRLDMQASAFEAQTNRLQRAQENATNRLQRSQENESNALQHRQERQQAGLEAMQSRRRSGIEHFYQRRIDGINNAVRAEEKANDIREKLFQAELRRIERLNEARNRNIDFNTALNEGKFDEAAKIRNDMEASTNKNQLEDQSDAASEKSANRVERLNKEIDHLEKVKQKRLDNISKVEARESAALKRKQEREDLALKRRQEKESQALKRRQEADSAALKKRQDRENKALQDSVDRTNDAEKHRWDIKKKAMEDALEKFTKYTATSEKDIERWVNHWKKQHPELAKHMGDAYEKVIRNLKSYLKSHMHDGAVETANANYWSSSASKIATKWFKSAWGMTKGEMAKFIATGKLPYGAKRGAQAAAVAGQGGFEVRHGGGMVGSGAKENNRGGYFGNKMHKNERWVLAEKGEAIINRKAASANAAEIARMNSGIAGHRDGDGRGEGGAGAGLGALNSLFMLPNRPVNLGISNAMKDVANKEILGAYRRYREAEMASALSGTFAPGQVRGFDAAQMRNAAVIANVGSSMGMSKRDIEIAFMTAIVESGMRNLPYGDRDSIGMFQQRNPWGSFATRISPRGSSRLFFQALKGVHNRGNMSMGEAAQAVQRSAFPGRYQQHYGDALRIWAGLHRKNAASGAAGAVVGGGSGGKHWPLPRRYGVTRGIHDQQYGWPGVDLAAPTGTPIYATNNGRVYRARDLNYSYGRHVFVDHGGYNAVYAHMQRRAVGVGARVKGGGLLGWVDSTGHSTGPHLHYGVNAPHSPYASLAKGAMDIKWDGTNAVLHKGEAVLTKDINDRFKQGVEKFANGPVGGTMVNVYVTQPNASAAEIVNKVVVALDRREDRRAR